VSEPETLLELAELEEGVDVECKKAAGRDGRGEVPRSFYETYSAMANTHGGVVYLGISQEGNTLEVTGLGDIARVRKSLWDGLNNVKQVSRNLLRDEMVSVASFGEHKVLKIRVPRASRHERPVHVGENPFDGTYRRNFEGDYRCDAETVKRMLAEQVEDARDSRVLGTYGLDDLDLGTLAAYRQWFASTKPDHVWLGTEDLPFLHSIGAWGRDRDTGAAGPTVAGLLMFGRWRSIRDQFPWYMLDYQERAEPRAELRWIDRITPDGTWSGNLFDFYRLVINKLGRDLKVPFRLEKGMQRVDDTPVHEALREALVNALIHADYTGRLSVLVVKRPDMFGFRNPGLMRVPLSVALAGGRSDCRNPGLQLMFRLVGLGDQAGSGIPKVFARWKQQHWRAPLLEDLDVPSEHTLFQLRMVSLLPADALATLEAEFGDRFRSLGELERLILVTAAVEGDVTHARINGVLNRHPRDLSATLAGLQRDGFLEARGATRAKRYFLPGRPLDGEAQGSLSEQGAQQALFDPATSPSWGGKRALDGVGGAQRAIAGAGSETTGVGGVSTGAGPETTGVAVVSAGAGRPETTGVAVVSAGARPETTGVAVVNAGAGPETTGVVVVSTGAGPETTGVGGAPPQAVAERARMEGDPGTDGSEAEAMDAELDRTSPTWLALSRTAESVRNQGKPRRGQMEAAILELCAGRWLLLRDLAELLARTPDWLRKNYLSPMVEQHALVHRYPGSPRHSRQAYRAAPRREAPHE
jgi:ATP-dependent DNA helicase RecG